MTTQSFVRRPASIPSALVRLGALLAVSIAPAQGLAQDRLKTLPGYEQYQAVGRKISNSIRSRSLSVEWQPDGKTFEYRKDGKSWRFDVANLAAVEVTEAATSEKPARERGGRGPTAPERGRQFSSDTSPDGKLEAFCRDRNLWLRNADGTGEELAITTEGDEGKRLKFGTASWVYGEELDQNTAMWWSPDSTKLAFYRFDESPTQDFYLQLDQTKVQSRMDVEAYPKAGAPNPIAEILIYDLAAKTTRNVDVRDGQPFTDDVLGHYAYNVAWSPDGTELLFNRTNRRQNVMEFCAADPKSGKCRVIVREEWPASWTENSPSLTFLEDGHRFLWVSERTGFKNYYLYDLGGKLHAKVTEHPFEVARIVRVDEAAGRLYYMARSGDNHMKQQLHRVGLDGKGDVRLTDPTLNHTVDLAPDGKHFVDVAQAHDVPPTTRLVDDQGKVLQELGRADLVEYEKLGLKRVELIRYPAADGVTELHGMLHFPSGFDPAKRYPLLVSVYAGPGFNAASENFALPSSLTEYGFLVANLDARSAGGRGKRFLDAIYQKLGTVEVDDLAAGVRSLWARPYLDKQRVGVFGTSYGGYAAALCLLRHPDAFQAACASSAVTDWRHYDTIYTERYQWTPQENKAGYDAGSAMTYADKLQGRLMLFYGTADNNVHPNNTMQLVKALNAAGKSFDLQVGPDNGHASLSTERMMEFFIENLVVRP
jgi:dipeptidyl-peptidase-4